MLDAETLAVGLGGDEALELGHELVVPAESELRFVPKLERTETPLLELCGLGRVDGLASEIGERRADPERKRLSKILRSFGRASRFERCGCSLDEPVEPAEVELRRVEPQPVAGSVPLDAIRPQGSAQPVHVDLERRHRGRRRFVGPEHVDEPVARDDRVRVQEQGGQQRALLRRSEGERAVVSDRLDRSQNAEFDAPSPLQPRSSRN